MPIRLLALDLDDTLLMPDLAIHPENIQAVRLALNAGVRVILASGRTIQSMRPYAELVGMSGRGLEMICVNGAEIRDVDSSSIIKQTALRHEDCIDVIRALVDDGLPVQAYDDEGILASAANSWTEHDCKLTGLSARIVSKPEDLAALPRAKLLTAAEPDVIAAAAVRMKKKFGTRVEIVISKPYFLEILPRNVDKGTALQWVAERHGIARGEVMAIGDAGNDVGMVSWAGFGCAPSDARAELRAAAKHIAAKKHDEAAVAELIHRFIISEQGVIL